MAGGRRLPPSTERLWLGELRRAHAIINIITKYIGRCGTMTVSYLAWIGAAREHARRSN
jgi:hypothetical protein